MRWGSLSSGWRCRGDAARGAGARRRVRRQPGGRLARRGRHRRARARRRRRDLRAPPGRRRVDAAGRRSAASRRSGPAAAAYGDAIHAFVTGPTAPSTRTCCAAAPGRAGGRSAASPRRRRPRSPGAAPTCSTSLSAAPTTRRTSARSSPARAGWPGGRSGATSTSGPALNSQDPGVVNVWHRGTDGQLMQRAWTGPRGGRLARPRRRPRSAPRGALAAAEHGRRVHPRHDALAVTRSTGRAAGLGRVGARRPAAARLVAGRGLGHARPRDAVRALRRRGRVQGLARRARMGTAGRAGDRSRRRRPRHRRPRRRRTGSQSWSPACAARRPAGACG